MFCSLISSLLCEAPWLELVTKVRFGIFIFFFPLAAQVAVLAWKMNVSQKPVPCASLPNTGK